MKKREITNNDMEQMFNKLIEQTPLLSEEQVNSILNKLPKIKSGSSAKHFFQNYLNTLAVGTIVLTIVVCTIFGIYSYYNNENESSNNSQENRIAPVRTDTIVVNSTDINNKKIVQERAKEDTILKTSSKIMIEPIQTVRNISLSDIYKQFEKQPQIFSFQASRDTFIVCKEGTSIKIKANTFISEKTGKEISGNVQIEVKEYYKLSDILLSNLSTSSGNAILETGGMIHIAASSDRENCIIKQGNEIEIGFPYAMKKDDMVLFNGEWTNERIDWKLVETITVDEIRATEEVIITEEEIVSEVLDNQIVEQMPEFPG